MTQAIDTKPVRSRDIRSDARADSTRRSRRVRSTDLLRPNEELVIEHAGREYRLRVTNTGKLILTA